MLQYALDSMAARAAREPVWAGHGRLFPYVVMVGGTVLASWAPDPHAALFETGDVTLARADERGGRRVWLAWSWRRGCEVVVERSRLTLVGPAATFGPRPHGGVMCDGAVVSIAEGCWPVLEGADADRDESRDGWTE